VVVFSPFAALAFACFWCSTKAAINAGSAKPVSSLEEHELMGAAAPLVVRFTGDPH
jgi:hypothetical protein